MQLSAFLWAIAFVTENALLVFPKIIHGNSLFLVFNLKPFLRACFPFKSTFVIFIFNPQDPALPLVHGMHFLAVPQSPLVKQLLEAR